jgi:hypothetical protein
MTTEGAGGVPTGRMDSRDRRDAWESWWCLDPSSRRRIRRTSPARVVAAILLLALGVCILDFAMTSGSAANRDFVCYWAAGQQLIRHANPYDGEAILACLIFRGNEVWQWTALRTHKNPGRGWSSL